MYIEEMLQSMHQAVNDQFTFDIKEKIKEEDKQQKEYIDLILFEPISNISYSKQFSEREQWEVYEF